MIKILLRMATIIVLIINCSENKITNPEPEPGRRDYAWTVDTLDIYSPIEKIWGSSPTDIWAINRSDQNHSIWHYNGNNWSTDGLYRSISPNAIWGFSENNIYIGGAGASKGEIWTFDGNNWSTFAELMIQGVNIITFENIWGEASNDFYAVGNGPDENLYANYSIIAHFKDMSWEILYTKDLVGNVIHLYKNKPDNKIYFQLIKIGGTEDVDSTLIYEYKSNGYEKIYGDIESRGLQADISHIDGEVYFILGNEIATRQKNKFITLLNMDSPNFYQRIWGRNSKDIFLLMTDGLAHYNGDNIEYLFHFTYANDKPWTQIIGAALFEKEVFFTVYEPPTRLKLIYHGKLQ